MKNDWLGDGGTAFMLSAKVLEELFHEMIRDLEEEINDLNVAAFAMFRLDKFLGNAIAGSIFGPIGVTVMETANDVEAGKNILKSVNTAIKDAVDNAK